jgi:pyruvate kinase
MGPACDSYAAVKKLIKAGMNVARLNMSHGDHAEHKRRIDLVRQASDETGVPVAVLLDTKGPEIRIKTFEKGEALLADGDYFTLCAKDVPGNNARVSVTYKDLPSCVAEGDGILLDDGLIELEVVSKTATEVVCRVLHGGVLKNRKSLNIPGAKPDMPYLSEDDKNDILFGLDNDVDYFALSFVRNVEDVRIVKQLLSRHKNGGAVQLIAKIENREGVDNVEKIVDECDGAMVARGDMGVEIPFEELPGIQKYMIKLCYAQGKKVITATQMLESMITNPRPTRAEISDVANAIYDGTSAIMLSGETSVGKYPVEAVRTMAKIAEQAERGISYGKRFKTLETTIRTVTDAVSHSTVSAAFDLNAKAIIAVSRSGFTVRKVSRFRPECVIIGATTSQKAYRQLAMNWGVVPVMTVMQPNSDELFEHVMTCAKSTGLVKEGDLVIITAGVPVGKSGTSNTMRIEYIK